MSEHGAGHGVAVGRPGKIACLLSGNFSLHEVMPDRSLRPVHRPAGESPYTRLGEIIDDMADLTCPG